MATAKLRAASESGEGGDPGELMRNELFVNKLIVSSFGVIT
jgi:hypothetical protein